VTTEEVGTERLVDEKVRHLLNPSRSIATWSGKLV
jgi:hypothetical protein